MLESWRSGIGGKRMDVELLSILFLVLLDAREDEVSAPTRMEEPFSLDGIINPRLFVQTVGIAPIHPESAIGATGQELQNRRLEALFRLQSNSNPVRGTMSDIRRLLAVEYFHDHVRSTL